MALTNIEGTVEKFNCQYYNILETNMCSQDILHFNNYRYILIPKRVYNIKIFMLALENHN